MTDLSIFYQKEGLEIIAFLKGSLVSLAAINLKSILHKKVATNEKLILDLTDVTDVDTTGINMLIQTEMRCAHKDATLFLKCKPDHPVNRMLRLTQTQGQFVIV